uniref:C2H2-type domain-containing protein n=1 Tax=Mola mola TaxID=94237 RepID=A0A3Q3WJH2_MOLML
MWEVVRQRNIKQYGKLEEFVSTVTDAVPELMSKREGRLLSLGLRARVRLNMLTNDAVIEAPEANFMKLVQGLIEDTDGREHFLKNVFPVEYGPDFDTALETLVCEFFTRLEELLPIPDFKQKSTCSVCRTETTSNFFSKANSVMGNWLRVVLVCTQFIPPPVNEQNAHLLMNVNTKFSPIFPAAPFQSDDLLIPPLCLPPSLEVAISSHPSACDDENNDVPQIVMFDEELSTNPSTSADFPESPKRNDMSPKTSVKTVYPRGRITHNCPLCGRIFKYRFEFLEHQRFHTAVKPYKCSQCGKAFRTEAHLSGHRKRKCRNAAHICTKCGCNFRSLYERVRHQCVQLLTKYECSHCGKTFKMAHLLRNHQMSEHQLPYSPNHRFRCRYCDETFPGISELKYHQRVDHEKPYQCQECGKCFLSEKCLANHELRHNDDRPESCLVCGRGFRNRYDLKQHVRTHTGERPYQCTHCSQCFSTAGGLRSHTRVHTGEKPHVCPDCGKAFSQMGAMRTHRLTHTGERPFKCTVCGKGFTMAHKVTVHMRVHTGERPYVCSQCGKAFSDGSVLKQHTLNHSGVRPYHCQICPKTYTCLNHLRRHLKSHSNMT